MRNVNYYYKFHPHLGVLVNSAPTPPQFVVTTTHEKYEVHGHIKSHVIDADLVLTDDDLESIRDAEEDLKKGKTKRLV